jgi:uncharacterized cupin superfamily protein
LESVLQADGCVTSRERQDDDRGGRERGLGAPFGARVAHVSDADNGAVDIINIFSAENTGGRIDVARAAGSTATLMFIYDVEPGEGSSPYHYEYEEEWLLVVEGTVVVRTPDGEQTLERGDLVRFPAGPGGAHKVMNRGSSPARTLLFSSARAPAVSVYPDSDTIGVWAGGENDLVFQRGTAVPWAHGEEGWNKAD